MAKVKSLDDLRKMREGLQSKISLREKSDQADSLVQIKVSMATCGIASGAKEIMSFLVDETDAKGVDAVITQTGCMGYCYAEPTIEVTLPGQKSVVFGHVDNVKAAEIVEKYIQAGELVDGIIPENYKTIKEE